LVGFESREEYRLPSTFSIKAKKWRLGHDYEMMVGRKYPGWSPYKRTPRVCLYSTNNLDS
jgi:hypothetical protein